MISIEDDILPQLRKATIIIRSFEPKRTDEEIASLATTSAEELDIKELLHAANLFSDNETIVNIYTKAVELHNDWRGYNNIACLFINEGDLSSAVSHLDKAEEIGGIQSDILINRGIIAAIKGELDRAQQLFNEGSASEKNQAVLDIKQGEYAKAARFYKGYNSYNAVLANILNGNYDLRCEDNYINAIAAARQGNNSEVIRYLKQAINSDSSLKSEAANDLEFFNLRENEEFKNLIN